MQELERLQEILQEAQEREKLLEQILAFELALAEKEDAACYRVSDVPGVREE